MIKGYIILALLLAGLGFAFVRVVKTATPNDQKEYDRYMRWKERKKHGKRNDERNA